MARPLVSICMITAQTDHPFTRRRESVYDLLRLSLADQTYQGPFEVIVADAIEKRLQQENQSGSGSWGKAARVVLTKQAGHDRIAISAARNTAAAYARGDLLVFVDDGIEMLPRFIEAAAELHSLGKVPTRMMIRVGRDLEVDVAWRQQGCLTDRAWSLSGQADGVFMLGREAFLKLNGFDENFDGNWGCEDQEFWARVDRLKLPRVGRSDLAVLRWAHHPTPVRKTLRRCREAYAQWAYRSPRVAANRRLSDAELEELRRAAPCMPTCSLCTAPDRKQQIETYRTIPADFDLRALSMTYSERPSGLYLDPWR